MFVQLLYCKVHVLPLRRFPLAPDPLVVLLPLVTEPDPGRLLVEPQPLRDLGQLGAGGTSVLLKLLTKLCDSFLVEHSPSFPFLNL